MVSKTHSKILLSILQISLISCFSPSSLEHKPTATTSTSLSEQNAKSIILPIFPLRKRVKFPTEPLKLTLWEDRYKDLSRYVMDNPVNLGLEPDLCMPVFGALYCSHKTQIVKGGIKPITPLVEAGDVGIICGVTSSQVFINGEEVDSGRKDESSVEKIRLWAHGLTRFRVKRILSDGLDEASEGKGGSLPFILVEGTRLDDIDVFEPGEDREIERMLEELLRRGDLEFDAASLLDKMYAYTFQEGDEKRQKQQMLSFALTAQLEATAPADEMLSMLQNTSTTARLKYLEKKLPRSNKWLGDAFRHLFE
jgi:hypothetical protein